MISYVCGVDFQHELEQGDTVKYPSVDALKAAKPCWEQCGIVEINSTHDGAVMIHKWVVEQDLHKVLVNR